MAFDEQIFALQAYGGISRMFAELATQFINDPDLGIELLPLNAPVINRYLLESPQLSQHLAVRHASHEYRSLLRYFLRVQPRKGQDVVHNTFYLPHGLVHYPKAKRIVTVHDMIPERMPETRRRLDFATLKKHYVQRADHVICVSESTKSDLLEIYGKVHAPISVVHHGVDSIFRPANPKPAYLPGNYIIFVGNRGGYKDASVLLAAFASLHNEFSNLSLLFVGGGQLSHAERERLSALGLDGKATQISLRDRDMPAAYEHATVCVFPSRFEGFGLPALEAMACGTPTVLADATSLPEVGGTAARYFAPGDADDLAAQLRVILTSAPTRQSLSEAGRKRASQFTWRRSAEETMKIYHRSLVG